MYNQNILTVVVFTTYTVIINNVNITSNGLVITNHTQFYIITYRYIVLFIVVTYYSNI